MKPVPTWICTVCQKDFQPRPYRQMPEHPCCSLSCAARLGRSRQPQLVDRFWKFVDKQDSGCWQWKGHLNRYGLIRMTGKKIPAHRAAWMLLKGEIPTGLCVCHHCDNPACVNPDHLFLGTHTDNMQDMVKKGRYKRPTTPRGKDKQKRKNRYASSTL